MSDKLPKEVKAVGAASVAAIDAEIKRLRDSPTGVKEFQELLRALSQLEKFCKAESEGAAAVAKATGLMEAMSEFSAGRMPSVSEQAHLTGVTFSAATHFASDWGFCAEQARSLRERLEQLKLADRGAAVDIVTQLRGFVVAMQAATARQLAEKGR